MRYILSFFFLSIVSIQLASGQTNQAENNNHDYKLYRDSLSKLSCLPADSAFVARELTRLCQIDTTRFKKNLHIYYHDLGWAYYRLYLTNKELQFVGHAIENYKRALAIKTDYAIAWWNLSFSYFLMNKCRQGLESLEEYKKYTDEMYWNKEQMKRMTDRCKPAE